MTSKTSIVLDDRALLAVSGEDARPFLQGLISNDVNKVGSGCAIYASLLTAQGKFLHDFFVTELAMDGERALVLDCEAGRCADLERRLTLYKLRAKVTLTNLTDDYVAAALLGEAVLADLGLAAEAGAACLWGGGVVYVDPRLSAMGARALLPRRGADEALAEAGFAAADRADYDRLRLAHGLPDGSRDMVVEKSFPLECGIEDLNGIDYDKGCYVGQELTARTHYRGTIRKRLIRVDIEGPVPAPGTPIMLGDKQAGEVRSGRDGSAIALLRLEQLAAVQAGGGPFTAGEARVTPVKPEWARF